MVDQQEVDKAVTEAREVDEVADEIPDRVIKDYTNKPYKKKNIKDDLYARCKRSGTRGE